MKTTLEFTPSAVLWDFYNTLVVPPASVHEVLEGVANEPLHFELGLDQKTLEKMFFIIRNLVLDRDGNSSVQPDWQEVWVSALKQIGFVFESEMVERLCRLQIELINAKWRLQDFVDPLFQKLCLKGIPMAVVSNVTGPADLFEGLLIKRGIRDYFKTCIWSAEIGMRKPHRSIFEAALQHLKIPASKKVVMVGDDEIADVTGANDLGLTAVKIVKDSQKEEPTEADYLVTAPEVHGLFSAVVTNVEGNENRQCGRG